MTNDILFQQERVGELQTDKFNGCEMQLWEDLSVVVRYTTATPPPRPQGRAT